MTVWTLESGSVRLAPWFLYLLTYGAHCWLHQAAHKHAGESRPVLEAQLWAWTESQWAGTEWGANKGENSPRIHFLYKSRPLGDLEKPHTWPINKIRKLEAVLKREHPFPASEHKILRSRASRSSKVEADVSRDPKAGGRLQEASH